jgi:hypothetical protein
MTEFWDGRDWEIRACKLLEMRHGYGNFFRVPDAHKGDYGLDGYSVDGWVYQAYAPEEPVSTLKRFTEQRDKVTADLNKLWQYRKDVEAMLGEIKIKRWSLFTPKHDSAELNKHCTKKTAEVKSWGLNFIDQDFRVIVETEENVPVEADMLTRRGAIALGIKDPEISDEAIDNWYIENDTFSQTIDYKLSKISGIKEEQIPRIRHALIREHLTGEALLDSIYRSYPRVWFDIDQIKRERAQTIAADSILDDNQGKRKVTHEVDRLTDTFSATVPTLTRDKARHLAYEAVTGWIMNCPMDFD